MARAGLQPASIDGIAFDALISYGRDYSAQIPDYPVEEGYVVQDTIILAPMTLSITAMLSDTPVTFRSHGSGIGRVENVAKQLEALYEKKKLVTVVTSRGVYRNMGIESLSLPYTTDTRTSMQVSIGLKQVRTVSAKAAGIPADYGRGGETGANAGTASTTPMTANTSGSGTEQQKADSKKASSTAYGIAESAGDFVTSLVNGW